MKPGGCPGRAFTLNRPLRMFPTSEGPYHLIHLEIDPHKKWGLSSLFPSVWLEMQKLGLHATVSMRIYILARSGGDYLLVWFKKNGF